MFQRDTQPHFSFGSFTEPCCSRTVASTHHLQVTEVGQTRSKKFKWRGREVCFLPGFQQGAITHVFECPCDLRSSRHSINQPGSWSVNCTGVPSVMSRFGRETRPVGGSSRDRRGLGLMSQQLRAFYGSVFFQECRLLQIPLIRRDCTGPLWRCCKRAKLMQLQTPHVCCLNCLSDFDFFLWLLLPGLIRQKLGRDVGMREETLGWEWRVTSVHHV